jgi:hypothetical protein
MFVQKNLANVVKARCVFRIEKFFTNPAFAAVVC